MLERCVGAKYRSPTSGVDCAISFSMASFCAMIMESWLESAAPSSAATGLFAVDESVVESAAAAVDILTLVATGFSRSISKSRNCILVLVDDLFSFMMVVHRVLNFNTRLQDDINTS